jgi:hypothetical protein
VDNYGPDSTYNYELPTVPMASEQSLYEATKDVVRLRQLRRLMVFLASGCPVDDVVAAFSQVVAEEKLDVDPELLVDWARALDLVFVHDGKMYANIYTFPHFMHQLHYYGYWLTAYQKVSSRLIGPRNELLAPTLMDRAFSSHEFITYFTLYTHFPDGLPVERLAHHVVQTLVLTHHDFPLAAHARHHWRWRGQLLWILEELCAWGLVDLANFDGEQLRGAQAENPNYVISDDVTIRFTPLGLWVARAYLTEKGMHTPWTGDKPDSFADLCARLGHIPFEEGLGQAQEKEISEWLDVRGAELCALTLIEEVRTSENALHRNWALKLLPRTGLFGQQMVEVNVTAKVAMTPLFAGWLVEQGKLANEQLDEETRNFLLAEQFVYDDMIGQLLPKLTRLDVEEQIDLLHVIARAGHKQAVVAFDAISRDHPERKVVKVANKLRLSLRNKASQ